MKVIETIPKLKPRAVDGHKGDYGKVCSIAGSIGMSGAAALAGRAALRAGAGLVKALEQYRRVAAKTLNMFKPIFGVFIFPAIKYQDIEAAFGQKELMSSMHDFLASKVPKMNFYFFTVFCN